MDKNTLKIFAIESRRDLMQKIEVKLKTYYVSEDFSKEQKNDIYILANENHSLHLTNDQYRKRELLIKRIKDLSLEQVIEEAAYTWFNRIIALRYMELNDILPLTKKNSSLGIRVLSSKDNKPDPEIMKFANLFNSDLDIELKKEYYSKLKEEDKFEYVLLLVCKKLSKVIPQVFDGVTDYIDILIPDNLLNEGGFVNKLVTEVPTDNFNNVEVIGWLYQYYNQIEKDRVIGDKKVYKKNEIPYATQLFTPDWIVKYMVENSLGRYWIENNGVRELYQSNNSFSKDNPLSSSSITYNWKYFIKDNLDQKKESVEPTEITFIDPCSGSGHILVYAFEVFYQIYQTSGYNKKDIPELILKHNLYGLDIDDRAWQLSVLSLLLKAGEYDKDIFNKSIVRNLNVLSLQESTNVSDYAIENLPESIKEKALYLKETFINAKEVGSLILTENRNYLELLEFVNKEINMENYNLQEYLIPLIKQADILSKKYDVVVTNPPYLNNSVMSKNTKEYLGKHYKEVKSDLFSAFIIRNTFFGKDNAYLGYMTPNVWMFLSSYEKLREYIFDNIQISSFIDMCKGSFFKEATVDIISFVLKNTLNEQNGLYFRLADFKGGMDVQENQFKRIIKENDRKYIYSKDTAEFKKIPGSPIAYWVSNSILDIYTKSNPLSEMAKASQGMATGENKKYLRQWYEVDINNTLLNSSSKEESIQKNKDFVPYNKGGKFRKWYGNNDYVIYFRDFGKSIAESSLSRFQNSQQYFCESGSWSKISSGSIAFRYKPFGHVFDVAGCSIFTKDKNDLLYLIGLNNSKVVLKILNATSPTLNYEVGHISNIPVIKSDSFREKIISLVKDNIELSKLDWDSFETSWDFKNHPLTFWSNYIKENHPNEPLTISLCFNSYLAETIRQFNQLKQNEEELNRIFIDIYCLKDELTPEVNEESITIRIADKVRDIKSLISYAVGCMFGRYSLDEEGLIFAGGIFDNTKYKSFKVDEDNIIPITDNSFFTDDIVSRFRKFIEIVYGKETLKENIDFIAETLGKRGTETSEETIRRYFLNDFYNDHIKIYQNKPIYWLFDSGNKNGFKCLIYMHRYNDGLVAKVRLDYLHRIQTTYERLLSDVTNRLKNDGLDLNTKKELQKQQVELSTKLQETIEYDEKIAHIANQRINIDLDEGVTTNYSKFVYTNSKNNKEESVLGKI